MISFLPADQHNPVFDLRDVAFHYSKHSGRTQDWTVQGLSLQIQAGEFLGVIGPNGSGKSTLLKLLAGVLHAHQGTLHVRGTLISKIKPSALAKMVGYVPQETHQTFPFTVAEMVLMGRFAHLQTGGGGFHWEGVEDWHVANQAMKDLNVDHLADRLISQISSGERQRAVIARALTQQPEILLLDEPTAFLDLSHQLEIARILQRLNREHGLTVILVSHDLNLASQYCQRLMLMSKGRISHIGTPEEVIRVERLEEVYGCSVLIDQHPQSGMPRVTLPV